jgi:hypothetical protein
MFSCNKLTLSVKVSVKLSLYLLRHHTIKAYWENGLQPGRFTPRGKCPRYILDWSLSGPQIRSGPEGEEINPCPYLELNPGRSAHRLVTVLTELSRGALLL